MFDLTSLASAGRPDGRPADRPIASLRWAPHLGRLATVIWVACVGTFFAGLVTAWVAGWRLEVIKTGSMEPTVPMHSLALVVPTGPLEVEVGDIVSFRDPTDRSRILLHRVIDINVQEDGKHYFETRGDANNAADPGLASMSDIRGRLRWQIPRLGTIAWAMRPPVSYGVFVGVPALLVVASEIRARRRRACAPDEPCPLCGRSLNG